jgi:hypothetical protein
MQMLVLIYYEETAQRYAKYILQHGFICLINDKYTIWKPIIPDEGH